MSDLQRLYVRDGNKRFDRNSADAETGIELLTMPDPVARLAFEMIEKWGMVAGEPDGEDSSGRAKGKLVSAGSLVTRAFDAAELAYAEARRRNHLTDIPTKEEANAQLNQREEQKALTDGTQA